MTDRRDEPVGDGPDFFGQWRVGRLVFDTSEDAESAARATPPERARPPKAPRIPPLDSRRLTAIEAGVVLRDVKGRPLGCVIGLAAGAHALWLGRRKVGEFASAAEAEAEAALIARGGAEKIIGGGK